MHLGKLVLMVALGATFAYLGWLLRLDDTLKPPSRERRDGYRSSPWRAWWIAVLGAGAGLLSGRGLGEAALLAAAVGAAVTLRSSPG